MSIFFISGIISTSDTFSDIIQSTWNQHLIELSVSYSNLDTLFL